MYTCTCTCVKVDDVEIHVHFSPGSEAIRVFIVQLMLFFGLLKMAEFEKKECCDTRLSQCVAVVSTSSDKNVNPSSDSQVKDQEEKPECILAVSRDRFWIVFDKIVRELSDRSVLNLALTEHKMFEDLEPAMRKRQTRLWLTPRQDKTFIQTLTIYPFYIHDEQFYEAKYHIERGRPICFTGCCSPSFTMDEESLRLIRRCKTILRLGDMVHCTVRLIFSSYIRVSFWQLKVIKSRTCKKHPLQLICPYLDEDL